VDSSVVGYDGSLDVREERSVGRKKLSRKPEPKRRKAWPRWTGFRGMTLRDWLPIVGALLIPVVIALGTWGITWQQGKIEAQRAEAERELAEQRAQDEALQAYLDQMNNLLLEHNLRHSKPGNEVPTLARARTLTVLSTLDPSRKTAVINFLSEADLITVGPEASIDAVPILELTGADLSGTDLSNMSLANTNLLEADLREANLSGTGLLSANLTKANLTNATLRDTQLGHAGLLETDLRDAKLRDANIGHANLSAANLSNADLRGADLTDAHVSEQQLRSAASLEGATMPDGQTLRGGETPNGPTFEDWLKSKGSGEGREPIAAAVQSSL
jgi:uncharacterized protein YjbI with pentapeptide repeats